MGSDLFGTAWFVLRAWSRLQDDLVFGFRVEDFLGEFVSQIFALMVIETYCLIELNLGRLKKAV